MTNKHPLVPRIRNSENLRLKFSEENNICGTCDLPDSNCSHKCKRYEEELEKLRKEKSTVNNGN